MSKKNAITRGQAANVGGTGGLTADNLVVARSSDVVGMMPWQMTSAQTFTTNSTLTNKDAGLVILSGTLAPLTATMPSVSAAPGSLFIIRTTSASGHVITGSAADAGVLFVERGIFTQGVANFSGSIGQRLTMPSTANASVVMMSDGRRWLVMGGSGSLIYAVP